MQFARFILSNNGWICTNGFETHTHHSHCTFNEIQITLNNQCFKDDGTSLSPYPLSINNQCLRHTNRLNSLEMISTNMLQIQSRCISITRNAYNSWVPYLAQPTKVGVSEYEYMVIPNIAVSVIISVSVAHT